MGDLAIECTESVFSFLLVIGMTDWPEYVRDTMSLLRPGKWTEIQDLVIDLYVHGISCSGEREWMKAIYTAAQQRLGFAMRTGDSRIERH